MGRGVTSLPYDFESISLDWLHTKPGAKWNRTPEAIAAWVADMDFAPAPAITAALTRAIETADLGYPDWRTIIGGSGATDAFIERCAARYGWNIDAAETREFNDVVQVIQLVLHTCTSPGDGVVVHTPGYPPFFNSIDASGCRVVPLRAQRTESSPTGWSFDYDELEATLRAQPAKVLLLCNPQNPTGHVFPEAELRTISALAERHDLLIISDEIHADLIYAPFVHRPIALFAPDRTVTIHAASKAFNLAGMRYAIAHFGSPRARKGADALPEHILGATNLMAAVAVEAAWRDGDEWLTAVTAHLGRQRLLLAELLAEQLPDVGYVPPAATYLAWLDCRALEFDGEGLGDDPSQSFLAAGVRLSEGPNFGSEGIGFARLNFATSSTILREIVSRMATLRG